MKRLIVLLCPLLIGAGSQGQMLTQSADGQGAIPLPLNGLGVSLDIGKTDATIGVNNYGRVLNSKTYKFKDNFLIGTNLSVKTANGLRQLLSSGDVVPEGNLLAFSGYSFSNMAAIAHALGSPHDLDAQKKKESARLEQRYKAQVQYTILKQRRKITDVALRDRMMSHLLRAVQECNSADEVDQVTDRADIDPANSTSSEALKNFKLAVKAVSAGDRKKYDAAYEDINQTYATLRDIAVEGVWKKIMPFRATIFLLGGINARGFTLYNGLTSANLSQSFQDTLFRAGNIGLGVNFQVANYWLGATYSYINADNFPSLRSKEYTLRTTNTAGNQTLIGEQKITAYPGKYSRVETNQLNIDWVAGYRLADTSRLLVNLYLRSSLASRDTGFLKNYTNIGAGFYFVNKKRNFLGGLYVELPDVNNNFEKGRPVDEMNIKSPFQKLLFGIVAKFSPSSILGLD